MVVTAVPIPAAVVTEAVDNVSKGLDVIKAYLIILTMEQRRKMAKASDKSYAFMRDSGDYAKTDPQFLPPFVTAEEMNIFLHNYDVLRPLMHLLQQFISDVNDTSMLNASNCFANAREYYNLAQQGAKKNVRNGKDISKDLSARFARKKRKQTPKEKSTDSNDMKAA